MSYDKKKLATYFQALITNCTPDDEKVDFKRPHLVLGGAGTRIEFTTEDGRHFTGQTPDEGPETLYVLEAGVHALQMFVAECEKDRELASLVGIESISKRLQSLLREIQVKDLSQLNFEEIVKKEVLQALRAEIRTWCVRVPINNLRLTRALTIGGVTFVRQEDGIVANTQTIMDHKGASDPIRNISDKASLLRVVGEISSQGTSWAIATIEAHEGRVKDVAREKIEAAINVVRAFTHVFHSYSLRSAFGLPYELNGGMTGFIAESESGFSIQMDRRGLFAPFEINDAVLGRLIQDFHFDQLARIAGANWGDLTSFEQAIKVAYQWLGRSVIALTVAESFTHCTIALERILIVDGEETTIERFADRLAYLLATEMNHRIHIHKSAKRLYDIRSRIVHAGFENVELSQLEEIENFAIGAIVKSAALLGELKDHNALRELLHQRKMS